MNEYETEDQQVEALKKWWKENGSSIIFGVVVGVSALFGWRYYLDQNNAHAMQASNLYMQMTQIARTTRDEEKIVDLNNTLINDFSDTPYAAMSSLAMAKIEYKKGNVDAAATQLELAIKNAGDEAIRQIANLRLTTIYIEQEKYDAAASSLTMAHDEAFDGRYEELRGDLFLAKGEIEQARSAYDKAINLYGPTASSVIRLKRQNLGAGKPGAGNPVAGDDTPAETGSNIVNRKLRAV